MVATRHSDNASPATVSKKTVGAIAVKKQQQPARKKLQVTAVPRRIQKYAPKANLSKFRKTKSTDEESVQVVKMLTGVLYLYRGIHPRAEFVRKV